MAAEAAAAIDYTDGYIFGSAAPARAPYIEPAVEPEVLPSPGVRTIPERRTRERSKQILSPFAVMGTIVAGVLMIFAVLAQISYNDIAAETVKLDKQFEELTEQEKMLAIQFENVIDMKEVERYARDVLGMSKPDVEQVAVIQAPRLDKAEIIRSDGESSSMDGFGAFISSLMEHFRKR